jgi:putative transposase
MKDSMRLGTPIDVPGLRGSRPFEAPRSAFGSRRTCFAAAVIAGWPELDASALSIRSRGKFEIRCRAVELYAARIAIRQIEEQTGVDRREIYRLIDRCTKVHEDGRAFGYRALVPYARVAGYQRVAQVRIGNTGGSRGTAGAFVMLLRQRPGLAAWIRKQIADNRVTVERITTRGGVRTRLGGLKRLHLEFLRECRAQGITAAEYPLNTERMGIRALAQTIRAERVRDFRRAGPPFESGQQNR